MSWTFSSISYQASCGRVVITVDLKSGDRAVLVLRILQWTFTALVSLIYVIMFENDIYEPPQ